MSPSEGTDRRQFLAFTVAGGAYAVAILKVREILQYEEVTRVPSTPPSIRGVLNLRGSVVPVVDLAVKLGVGETAPTSRACVVVVETAFDGVPAVMGVMAEAVSEVVELEAGEIEPPPAFGRDAGVEYLLGMGKVGRDLVLLLDVDAALSADEHALARAAARGELDPAAAEAGPLAAPAPPAGDAAAP